jgi:cytochrome oxidase Cu insertion factor (SCO1/SenC/PrrC family)
VSSKGKFVITVLILALSCGGKVKEEMAGLSEDSVQIGDIVPDFQVQSTSGENVKISDFRGKWVVLFFYPKALTLG